MKEFLEQLIKEKQGECSTSYKTPQQLQSYNNYIHSKGLKGHLVLYYCETCAKQYPNSPYHLEYVDQGICNTCKYYILENYTKWENMCKIKELNTYDYKSKCNTFSK